MWESGPCDNTKPSIELVLIKLAYETNHQRFDQNTLAFIHFDTFCIMKKGSEMVFLEHLNKVRPSIKFTVELEKDGKLPFLDCLLEVGNDGKILSTVYRKQTHTDRYLNYRSHHPIHVERGVIKSLYDRATRVTTHEEDLVKEHNAS